MSPSSTLRTGSPRRTRLWRLVAVAVLVVMVAVSGLYLSGRAATDRRAEETRDALPAAIAASEDDFRTVHEIQRQEADAHFGAEPFQSTYGYACSLEPTGRNAGGDGWVQLCSWHAVDMYRTEDAEELAHAWRAPIPPGNACSVRSAFREGWLDLDLDEEPFGDVYAISHGGGEDGLGQPCTLPQLPEHVHLTGNLDVSELDPEDGWVIITTGMTLMRAEVGCGPGLGCPAPFDTPAMPEQQS